MRLANAIPTESGLNLQGHYNDVDEDATMRTNYPAVVVCAIVYWLLGGLWFDLLFSKRWMALEHMSEAQASSANPVWIWPFILTFLLNLLIAFVLAQVCIWRNANTAARGAALGMLLWLLLARLLDAEGVECLLQNLCTIYAGSFAACVIPLVVLTQDEATTPLPFSVSA